MWITLVIIAAAGGIAAFALSRINRKRKPGSNVTSLSSYKRRQSVYGQKAGRERKQQKCSFCKQTSNRITFYTDDNGVITGVCPKCRPIALQRDLTPL